MTTVTSHASQPAGHSAQAHSSIRADVSTGDRSFNHLSSADDRAIDAVIAELQSRILQKHASRAALAALATPPVARQAAIENALNMALQHVRQPGGNLQNVRAATVNARRALTMLKQESEALSETTQSLRASMPMQACGQTFVGSNARGQS